MRTSIAIAAIIGALSVPLGAQKLQRINPPLLSTPQTYTHIVRAGTLLFISGQVGVKPDGTVVGPGMREQLEQVLANLDIALKSQNASFANIAKITIFTTSVAEFREAADVRAKYFGDNKPASTLVQIAQLASPDYKVEIEAIAVLPSSMAVTPVKD